MKRKRVVLGMGKLDWFHFHISLLNRNNKCKILKGEKYDRKFVTLIAELEE